MKKTLIPLFTGLLTASAIAAFAADADRVSDDLRAIPDNLVARVIVQFDEPADAAHIQLVTAAGGTLEASLPGCVPECSACSSPQ